MSAVHCYELLIYFIEVWCIQCGDSSMDINKPDSDATLYLLDVSNDVWYLKFVLGIIWAFFARKGYQMVFKYGADHTIAIWNVLKEFGMVVVDFSQSHPVDTFWYMEQDFRFLNLLPSKHYLLLILDH